MWYVYVDFHIYFQICLIYFIIVFVFIVFHYVSWFLFSLFFIVFSLFFHCCSLFVSLLFIIVFYCFFQQPGDHQPSYSNLMSVFAQMAYFNVFVDDLMIYFFYFLTFVIFSCLGSLALDRPLTFFQFFVHETCPKHLFQEN